jgi:hypothetical protein
MRTLNRCTLLALAAGLTAVQRADAQVQPSQPAQGQQPRTHTVVRGDNLWDLSQTYLGNPFLWPEIYRLNRDVVEDPHWIYPGEILRLPGGDTTAVPNIAVIPDSTRIQGPETPTIAVQPPVDTAAPTVFTRRYATSPVTGTGAGSRAATATAVNVIEKPTVRAGEVIAAPYVDREGGPRGFGRILKSGDLTGVAQASERFRFQAYDKIFINPPVGYVAPEGERYLAVRLGPMIEDQGQIVIPTGVVEVTAPARGGMAATAKVVRSYAGVESADRLIPIDTSGVGTTIKPQRVDGGASTTIKWISGQPVLPSVQNFVVLATSSRNGIRMGDEFTVYLPRKKSDDERRPDEPEIMISKMQVVRSTPYGVTAVIVGQEQPAIREGMNARITAKMP